MGQQVSRQEQSRQQNEMQGQAGAHEVDAGEKNGYSASVTEDGVSTRESSSVEPDEGNGGGGGSTKRKREPRMQQQQAASAGTDTTSSGSNSVVCISAASFHGREGGEARVEGEDGSSRQAKRLRACSSWPATAEATAADGDDDHVLTLRGDKKGKAIVVFDVESRRRAERVLDAMQDELTCNLCAGTFIDVSLCCSVKEVDTLLIDGVLCWMARDRP